MTEQEIEHLARAAYETYRRSFHAVKREWHDLDHQHHVAWRRVALGMHNITQRTHT